MTKYVYEFTEGDKSQKDLLGGKGANLAEMTNLGLPVPPGFTITTEACREYLTRGSAPGELRVQVTMALRQLEDGLGRRLGDRHDPLLVSVRSGAAFSMPGMMETVLNIGLNDASVKGLAEESGDERFAWDSYRRLLQMFGKTVLETPGEVFSEALDKAKSTKGVATDVELDVDDLKELVSTFKDLVREHSGHDFPQHPREQLDMAINAVFNSWNTDRARLYRRRERIPQHLGTAVNVCTMVFGNLGEDSGTGVAFTRDPASGRAGAYGDYLPNAQGEDVVAGIRNTLSLDDLKALDPASYKQLIKVIRRLETHYRDLCDIEFTIERGKLWMLQTRVGKRTAAAAFRIASQLVDENLITMDEALSRVSGSQLALLMFPQFDRSAERELLTRGMAASPGAAVGRAVFDSPTAKAWAERGERVVLVRKETNPDDLAGMIAADGILTARGGKTSHAAVVARGMGKTCVCGAEALDVDAATRTARVGTALIAEGDAISIDGSTGEIFLGAMPVVRSPVETYIECGLAAAVDGADGETTALVTAVDRLLTHADDSRRLTVRANADTAEDAASSPTVLPISDLSHIGGVAVDTGGNVYVPESGGNNRVLKLAPGASSPTVLPFTDLKQPVGVAVDTGGNVYVPDWGANERVLKLAPGVGAPTVLPFTDLKHPSSVAVDAGGHRLRRRQRQLPRAEAANPMTAQAKGTATVQLQCRTAPQTRVVKLAAG